MTEPFHNKESCPFWSPDTLTCTLDSGGLFIPLDDDHIEVYCKTGEYPQCLQYSISCESYLQSRTGMTANDNRRRHARVECSHNLTLAWPSDPGMSPSHSSIEAAAIDMSTGGLRLRSMAPLSNDTVVWFSFDEPVSGLLQSGAATIKWCHRLIDRSEYQAGLAFLGNLPLEAMGRHLDRR
jgi:hypothetical protein